MEGKTPVSALQELLLKQQIVPSYNLILNGVGSHEPVFKYEVTGGDYSAVGSGKSKKEAKHNAARELLKQMNEIPVTDDLTSPYEGVLKENAIGELADFCFANQLKLPEYKLTRDEGLSHAKVFSLSCTVSSFTTEGTARTKKNAKQIAAQDMLLKLREYLKDFIDERPMEKVIAERNDLSEMRMNKAVSEVIKPRVDKLGLNLGDYCFALKNSALELPYLDSLKEICNGSTVNIEELLGENCERIFKRIVEELQCEADVEYLETRKTPERQQYSVCLVVHSIPPWTFMHIGSSEGEALRSVYTAAVKFMKFYIPTRSFIPSKDFQEEVFEKYNITE